MANDKLRQTEPPPQKAPRSWWLGLDREKLSEAQKAEQPRMVRGAKPGMGMTVGWGPAIGKTR